jgi:hypothetical protein
VSSRHAVSLSDSRRLGPSERRSQCAINSLEEGKQGGPISCTIKVKVNARGWRSNSALQTVAKTQLVIPHTELSLNESGNQR